MKTFDRRLRQLEDAQRVRSAAYNGAGVEAFIAEIDRLAARLRADPNWPFEPQPSTAEVEEMIRELLAEPSLTAFDGPRSA